MDRGVYASTANGLVQMRKLEVVNNNLANINTPGFKKEMLTGEVQTFDQTLASLTARNDPYAFGDHQRTPGVVNIGSATDFTPGPIQTTGRSLDVAVRNEKDFFQVITPSGIQYTRAGNFTLNEQGNLLTPDGFSVQGDGGAITAEGVGVRIAADGSVMANGTAVGRVGVVRFDDTSQLEAVGGNRFRLKQGAPAPVDVEPDLIPESLEASNVSAISGVVDLISASRAFQMYARTLESVDTLNQAAINQIGRPRG
jgi:flagellar basal-body rod protein FlgF